MKTLPAPKFLIYAVLKALRHPRTPIIGVVLVLGLMAGMVLPMIKKGF